MGLFSRKPEQVRFTVKTVAEAQAKLKEFKQQKKEAALRKRQVMEEQRRIRADYTESQRKPSVLFGKQTESKRRQLAVKLAPLEKQRQHIEEVITSLDKAIVAIEQWLDNPT